MDVDPQKTLTIKPRYRYTFEESNQHYNPAGWIVIKQLENVHSTLSKENTTIQLVFAGHMKHHKFKDQLEENMKNDPTFCQFHRRCKQTRNKRWLERYNSVR